MFEDLRDFAAVVVCGPHRSGTTICAEMIGHDTGLRVVREEAFSGESWERFAEALAIGGVIQAPAMSHRVRAFDAAMCVIFMLRDVQAIERSVCRLPDASVVRRYREREYGTADGRRIYARWRHDRAAVQSWREVEYESLRGHHLWIEDRSAFGFRQTAT